MKFTINKNRLTKLCEQNDISYLGVFGSYAKGEQTPKSDVDLLVRFSKKKSLLDLVKTQRKFKEALGREVDLLTEGSISPYLIDNIRNEIKVIYQQG